MDELEKLRLDRLARMQKQNERRIKANKPLMHKGLDKKVSAAKKRAALPKGPGFHKTGLPLPESGQISDSAMRFDEWQAIGYTVKKGSKAEQFDAERHPLFDLDQIQKINPAWAQWRARQARKK